jgi:DMSO/TMAO reductase YedYZ molybdopterin-dependent catalytic subunit
MRSRIKSRLESPPGPFRRSFWRSPIRGPWLTSMFGLVLLASIPVVFATGLLSYAAYNPDLSPVNDETRGKGLLGFYLFSWPTHPVWLYRLNQGVHVTLGLILVPILLFKLWSVLPKLFEWPPVRSPAHALERLSLFLLVGGAVFEFATGILNIQTWYKFPGSFYPLHFYGAWVFVAGFVVHVTLKLPVMIRALRSRSLIGELRSNLSRTRPEPLDAGYLVAVEPAEPTISRRGILAFAGAGSALIAILSVGQSLGGPRCSPRTARTSAAGPATSRSTRPREAPGSRSRRPARPGGSGSCTTARLVARLSCCAGPTCSAWNSTPPACRSRASRGGPPTIRPGAVSGCATSPGWPASHGRRASWCSPCSAAARSARRR